MNPVSSAEPPRIPDHELFRRIGGGSCGDVWLARNIMGTARAVKIVQRKNFERGEHFEREFKGIQKFEPISRSHEGFVDILQIGRNDQDGYFYYVMELADSIQKVISNQYSVISSSASLITDPLITDYSPKTLRAEQQRHGHLPVSDCVNIGIALASALAELHKQGLVHRDVKPSNIIFVNGVPKLADIGLVADTSEARSFVGTIGFIPPEGPGTPQADLYSLGKVLYEISTGQDRDDFPQLPPEMLRGEAGSSQRQEALIENTESEKRKAETDQSLLTSAATNSNDVVPLIELNEILLRACHKDIRQRYQSAEAMLADLQLLPRGKSVKRKHAIKRRLGVIKGFALVGVIVAASVAGLMVWRKSALRSARVSSTAEMRGTKSAEAWSLYQQGRFFAEKQSADDTRKAIDYFERAIHADVSFARAYVGLGTEYGMLAIFADVSARECFVKAEANVRRALELDSTLAEAWSALGWIKTKYGWNLTEAERLLRYSLKLNPNEISSLNNLAICLSDQGKSDEAIALHRKILSLDPVSLSWNRRLGLTLFQARRYDEAIAAYRKAVDLHPNNAVVWLNLAAVLTQVGKDDESAAAYMKSKRLSGASESQIEELKQEFAREGLNGLWAREAIRPAEAGTNYVRPLTAAMNCARAGDHDGAIQWLENLYDEPLEIARIKVLPEFDPLRSNPRFIELLRRTGLDR